MNKKEKTGPSVPPHMSNKRKRDDFEPKFQYFEPAVFDPAQVHEWNTQNEDPFSFLTEDVNAKQVQQEHIMMPEQGGPTSPVSVFTIPVIPNKSPSQTPLELTGRLPNQSFGVQKGSR